MSNGNNKYFKRNQSHRLRNASVAAKRMHKVGSLASDNDGSNEFPNSSSSQHGNIDVYTIHRTPEIPYYGWKVFFENEDYKDGSGTVKKIQAVVGYLERQKKFFYSSTIQSLKADMDFNINVAELRADQAFLSSWNEFQQDLERNAHHTLNCLKCAIYQRLSKDISQDIMKAFIQSIHGIPNVRIKLLNYEPVVDLRDLPKIESYDKLISTRGYIIRVERPNRLIRWLVYSCSKCDQQTITKLSRDLYEPPKKCDVCGSQAKFKPLPCSSYTKSVPFQIIRVQELPSNDENDKGRMPVTIQVKLTDDLVGTCLPGDDITLTGIIKMQGVDGGTLRKDIVNAIFVEAITMINNKNTSRHRNVQDEMTMADYLAIKEIHDQTDVFRLLVHSLCPDIYGHEMLKAGLLLSLFGGNTANGQVRDGIHVLAVGDPGLGKSQMLQACARAAQKGLYICGNSSSSSGLTVTLSKESLTNDYALEPGALVLADGGCCCIDEFDKMSDQHQALLEAMEQQRVSVAKSGVLCALPARTAILAAANPVGGRYNKGKTMTENLNMSQPLLSRFDLIFLLLDDPNADMDSSMCKHVMSVHNNGIDSRNETKSFDKNVSDDNASKSISLKDRLTLSHREHIDRVPQTILRKYVTYARQYVKPRLNDDAAAVIKKYYLELRCKTEVFPAVVPVCNRQFEAMIRLTEARAKVELRDEANMADATEVVEIMKYTMANVPHPQTITPESRSRSGKITANMVKGYINLIKRKIAIDKKSQFTLNELYEMGENGGYVVDEFPNLISKLNEHGILLKIGSNVYKFVSD